VESESLQPHLDEAQRALKLALDQACDVDLGQVDTGELIRIEETLALASKAAKQAVSVRLRMRRGRDEERGLREQTIPEPSAESASGITQRVFDDIRGKRWRVFAVHPSTPTAERAALPESFRQGWLSFEASDEMRRVAPIPPKWEELPIEELRMLCHRADSAPKRINALGSAQSKEKRG
jgi:hypothetical protein